MLAAGVPGLKINPKGFAISILTALTNAVRIGKQIL